MKDEPDNFRALRVDGHLAADHVVTCLLYTSGISRAVCAPQAFVGGGEAAPAVIGAAVLPLFGAVREALAALAAANFAGERIAVAVPAAACRTVAAGQLSLHRLPRFPVDDGLVVILSLIHIS